MGVGVVLKVGAELISVAAPTLIAALTKKGAKKIAKPTAEQTKKAVSVNSTKLKASTKKKIQSAREEAKKGNKKVDVKANTGSGVKVDVTKPKPKLTGTAARKARRKKTDGRSTPERRAKQSAATKDKTTQVAGEPVVSGAKRTKTGQFAKKSDKKAIGDLEKGVGVGTGILTAGLMAASGDKKLKVGQTSAKADEKAPMPKPRPKSKVGEPVAKPRSTEKKKLAGDELGPSAGADTTGPKKKESEDVKRRRKSQLNKPKGRAESLKDQLLRQGRRKYGKFTVDSTDEGMSKFLGSKEDIERQEMEEEMNLYRGGMAFGKGGLYKAPKKTYGMRSGGFTRRGASR